ncbi:hypothetical protein AALO_G00148040 [Alosa alosa]|uniref:Uncharacterized protein n=1 Tax=Alosa alosa TaxID=278164 RepID=A0AAV6GGZ2_9TELE|nr:hypothetical protein AALO_G00148040 [Alosa alosa]
MTGVNCALIMCLERRQVKVGPLESLIQSIYIQRGTVEKKDSFFLKEEKSAGSSNKRGALKKRTSARKTEREGKRDTKEAKGWSWIFLILQRGYCCFDSGIAVCHDKRSCETD